MESMGQIDPVIVWWPCVGTLISVGHDKSYTNTQLERGLRRMPEAWKGVWCCSAPTWPVDYERRLQYLILARMVRGANETAFKPFPAWRRHRYTWGRLGWAFEGNVDRLRRIFPLDRTVAENMAVAPEMNEMSVAVFIYDPGTAPVPPPNSAIWPSAGCPTGKHARTAVAPFGCDRYTGPAVYFVMARQLAPGEGDSDELEQVMDACLDIYVGWKGGIRAYDVPTHGYRPNRTRTDRRVN